MGIFSRGVDVHFTVLFFFKVFMSKMEIIFTQKKVFLLLLVIVFFFL